MHTGQIVKFRNPQNPAEAVGGSRRNERYNSDMTAIRAIFDGKVFVPQQPVSVPPQSEVLVLVDGPDQPACAEAARAIQPFRLFGRAAADAHVFHRVFA